MSRRSASIMLHVLGSTVGRWLWWYYRISVHYHDRQAARHGPMLLLSNHVNFWDPFLLAFGLRVPIRFLAADGNFRTRGMRVLMTAMGAIPKAKARTDMESLRILQREIANREIVALFPEGQRTWDGRPRPIPPATGKLARILGAPVVAAEIRGGYLSKPRWARTRRRGRIEIHVRTVVRRAELTSLPRPVVQERIARAVAWNDHHWQRDTERHFRGDRPAEGVEQAVYWCPVCGAWGAIRGAGDRIHCTSCAAEWWFTSSGTLFQIAGARNGDGERLPHLGVWGERQETALRHSLQSSLPYHFTAEYSTGYRSRPLRWKGSVRGTLTDRLLVLHPRDAVATTDSSVPPPAASVEPTVSAGPTPPPFHQFPLSAISAIQVQYTRQLEFYTFGTLHVLRVTGPHDSAARVEATVLALQELYKSNKH
ncbi:MAG: lysophospholipid acyltransferase family protein [Alkalispirochaeta sp.]